MKPNFGIVKWSQKPLRVYAQAHGQLAKLEHFVTLFSERSSNKIQVQKILKSNHI